MTKSIRVYTKKNRAEKTGTMVGVRLQDSDLGAIDDWRAAQVDHPSRPEAIRRLLSIAFSDQ